MAGVLVFRGGGAVGWLYGVRGEAGGWGTLMGKERFVGLGRGGGGVMLWGGLGGSLSWLM